MNCPCGTGAVYADCCEPLHHGQKVATTAEQMMRSRYAAYVCGEIDYLLQTLHPDKRRPNEVQELAAAIADTRWMGLDVIKTVAGSREDTTGIVEFLARYTGTDGLGTLHERSRFVKENGKWLYVDAEMEEAAGRNVIGRNDPCSCGSGKKFKKCCGS